mgnify:CR=1 FL=1
MPLAGLWAARVLGMAWTLPNTLLGLIAGLVLLYLESPKHHRLAKYSLIVSEQVLPQALSLLLFYRKQTL